MNLYSICILIFLPFIHSSIIKSIGLKSSSLSSVSSPNRRSCEDHDDDYVYVPVYIPNQSTHRTFTTNNQLPLILPNMFRMNIHNNDLINLPHFIPPKFPFIQHTIPVKNLPYHSTIMDNPGISNQHIYDFKMKTFDQPPMLDFTGQHMDDYKNEKNEFDAAEAERRPDVFEAIKINSDYETNDANENIMKSNNNEIDGFSSNEFDHNIDFGGLPDVKIYPEKREKSEYSGKTLPKMPPLLVKKPVKSKEELEGETNHKNFPPPTNDYPDLKNFLSEYDKEMVTRPMREPEKNKLEISEPSFDKNQYYKAEYDNAFNRQLDYTKLPAKPFFRKINEPKEISSYDSQKPNEFESNDYKMEAEGEEKDKDKNFDFYEFNKFRDSDPEYKDEDKFSQKIKNDENNYQSEDVRTKPYNDDKFEMEKENNNDEYNSSKPIGYELDKPINANDDDERLSEEEEAEKSVMYQYDSPAYTEYETKK